MSEQTIKAALLKKSLNEEKRLATFLVLEPQDEDYTTSDLHGDWYDLDTVEDACHSFNRFCRKANLFHLVDTTAFEFVESYITESDMLIGEEHIKKGSWLAKIYVNKSEAGDLIWKSIKSGEFNGLSGQCEGFVSDIE